jgi:poly(A) polymerase
MPQDSPEQLARDIAAGLKGRGFQAYLVGGCVRDRLLGRRPDDYDVSTNATPEHILEIFPGAKLVGAKFGVVLVTRESAAVEVATFRTDGVYRDGRRPDQVVFETDPQRDVERRDFTINGLMMDPFSEDVIDLVGGRRDLEAHLIRAIGDPRRRFEEDRLRMLRAVRFAARLGFDIEPDTFGAIRELSGKIREISPERVRDELVRILVEGGARRGFEWMDETGLLAEILPEISAMKGVEQPPQYHPEGDVWTHTLIMLDGLRDPTPELALGVLLHDVGKPSTFRVTDRIRFNGHVQAGVELTRRIMNRLRFSNEQISQVEALVANHMRFMHIDQMRDSTLKRFFRLGHFDQHLELHRLDCASSRRSLRSYNFARERFASMSPEERKPSLLLTGHDLIRAGYAPGPEFSTWLDAAEDAQLEGRIATREEALALVRTLAAKR